MWNHEYTGETTAAPEAVWAVLKDIDDWARWDTSMEAVSLLGAFEVGGKVSMTPTGQEPIVSVITDIQDGVRYADETEFEGVVLRFSHTLSPRGDGGTRVVHRLEISGPQADRVGPELGPAITEDFPQAMAALLARAVDLAAGTGTDGATGGTTGGGAR
ncbi:SRPBCC family protein [Kitasatospora sp. NPDC004745]|uniref:SRPBCC family protein n=1 Tax=Kitasatospora sp. NPDC004745 TaxID=3364019 RepID=UPI003698CC8C